MTDSKNEVLPFITPVFSRQNLDEVTYNKIQRHLLDINDTITEEDIRNVKLYVAHSDKNVLINTLKVASQ